MGFLIAPIPFEMNLMGCRGAGGGGVGLVGVFYSLRGLLQIISSIMEWIIGILFHLSPLALTVKVRVTFYRSVD